MVLEALDLSVVRVAASTTSACSQLVLSLRRDAVANVSIPALFHISYCQLRLLSDVIKCPAKGPYPSARNLFCFSQSKCQKMGPSGVGFRRCQALDDVSRQSASSGQWA